jgi:tellurite resistance protein TehA-like permease
MTSADLLIVLVVGIAVGALTGVVVGTSIGPLWIALLAGFLGTIIGAIVRNYLMFRVLGRGPDDDRTPWLVILYALIASLAGSTAALEIAQESGLGDAAAWIGTLAGLFSAILMAMLLITYHTHPGQPPKLRRHRH